MTDSPDSTNAELIARGEQLERLLLEYVNAWLAWAPRMRAAHAEASDNTASLAAAIQRHGCDLAQARMSELERDMQPLAAALRVASRLSACSPTMPMLNPMLRTIALKIGGLPR